MPVPAIGAALMGLARVAGTALGTQAGRKGLMEGAKKVGVKAKDYAKEKGLEKVAEANPMDAAMEHMKEKQRADAANTQQMLQRTQDKASGGQTTTAGFGN